MNNKKNKGLFGSQFLLLILLASIIFMLISNGKMKDAEISYSTFVSEVQNGKVKDVVIHQNKEVPTNTRLHSGTMFSLLTFNAVFANAVSAQAKPDFISQLPRP